MKYFYHEIKYFCHAHHTIKAFEFDFIAWGHILSNKTPLFHQKILEALNSNRI